MLQIQGHIHHKQIRKKKPVAPKQMPNIKHTPDVEKGKDIKIDTAEIDKITSAAITMMNGR